MLCELAWVLRGLPFGYTRGEIADTMELLLEIDIFDIDARDFVRQAARGFRSGDADFADYLIGSLNRNNGCRTTLTFDRGAGESDLFEVLGA